MKTGCGILVSDHGWSSCGVMKGLQMCSHG